MESELIAPPQAGGWKVHALFGVRLATDFELHTRLGPAAAGPPDLVFRCSREAPPMASSTEVTEAASTHGVAHRPIGSVYLDRPGGIDVIRYTGIFDFYIWIDRIYCHVLDPAFESKVEIALLGTVLSYWMERRGMPVLHASAVEVDGGTVAFLADNRGGKTSLAVAMMRAGHPLVTDDILPLELHEGIVRGRPGYPQLRLWPEQLTILLPEIDASTLQPIHPAIPKLRVPVDRFGAFAAEPRPIYRVYVPERRPAGVGSGQIEIAPLPMAAALRALQSQSFEPQLAEAAGHAGDRLRTLGSLLRQATLRKLAYPSGVEHLGSVCDAVLLDLANN